MFLEVKNLHVSYSDGANIINDLNFYINKGEIVSLIGSNGAGKTTILKTITGLLKPSEGEMFFNSKDLVNFSPQQRVIEGITMVPEGKRLFKRLTVHQNLLLGAYTKKSKQLREDTIERIIDLFPVIKRRMKQNAGTLSGGEQQMLAVGRALMSVPKLLMLDEPSLGIMPTLVRELFEMIEKLRIEMDLSILLVEQNVKKAIDLADRTYVLQTGRIIKEGGKELLDTDLVRKAFLGM
jgi:branched-chain amino acid transport system ATP-binding protein